MYKEKTVSMIFAKSINWVIGIDNRLPWHSKKDLSIFKAMTKGCCVIMGRKTWESLPVKPLPLRDCVVITSNKDYKAEGARVVGSLEEALDRATEPVMIIGGSSVYENAMQYADTLYVSTMHVAIDPRAGDLKYAPRIPECFGLDTQVLYPQEGESPAFMFSTYSRRSDKTQSS